MTRRSDRVTTTAGRRPARAGVRGSDEALAVDGCSPADIGGSAQMSTVERPAEVNAALLSLLDQ